MTTRSQLETVLEREVGSWASKSPGALRIELAQRAAYSFEVDGRPYQAEVEILEDTSEYLHVVVIVDDTSLGRAIKPLNRSFLVRSDGTVDR